MISPETLIQAAWITLGLYWVAKAAGTKKVAVNENTGLRAFRLAMLGLMLALLMTDWLRIGLLARRFAPRVAALAWAGVVLTWLGVGIAIWARRTLGANWSDKVVLKVDHELIRNGPYRYLRHPIYTGVLLAVAGTTLMIGEWRGVAAFVVVGTNYYVKAKREERILAIKFGEAFAEHKRRTGFFLPCL